MLKSRWMVGVVGLSLFAPSCAPAAHRPLTDTPSKIILFIADGAGAGHWAVARIATPDLEVNRFTALGLVDVRGWNHLVTESAQAASALATGERSVMGALSLSPDSVPRTTVLEIAQARGMATGLITTTRLTDATPAAFATHYPSRDHLQVARQMAAQHVTVLLGGGREIFTLAPTDGAETALAAMRQRYSYVETAEELEHLRPDTVELLLGLFAEGDMALAPERAPSLAAMTGTAIAILDREQNGFFLMVENEETDTQAHRNQGFDVLAAEMLAFNEAIAVAVAYQRRHHETLIIVTGDHETGGLTVQVDSTGAPTLRYTTTGHTAGLLPLFASGPGADRFRGLLGNDQVGRILRDLVQR
ncbi:MAG: alkaline phosphatase [Gemmatimonadota bacterium]|nr:alkaline phosphatase [Gemmatimonadota bacterium]MDH3477374.1 alkaline phosphatase [Gemmatimonadota bacterium]MDH3571353.1 alkaline phosphatase [Gemmatimonadota bacterium]MDH5551687.1 alkaline phosphatase [Gemmatimonadota bacterium]